MWYCIPQTKTLCGISYRLILVHDVICTFQFSTDLIWHHIIHHNMLYAYINNNLTSATSSCLHKRACVERDVENMRHCVNLRMGVSCRGWGSYRTPWAQLYITGILQHAQSPESVLPHPAANTPTTTQLMSSWLVCCCYVYLQNTHSS